MARTPRQAVASGKDDAINSKRQPEDGVLQSMESEPDTELWTSQPHKAFKAQKSIINNQEDVATF